MKPGQPEGLCKIERGFCPRSGSERGIRVGVRASSSREAGASPYLHSSPVRRERVLKQRPATGLVAGSVFPLETGLPLAVGESRSEELLLAVGESRLEEHPSR